MTYELKGFNIIREKKAISLEKRERLKEILKHFLVDTPIYYDKNRIWWLWDSINNKWEMTDETDLLILVKEALEVSSIAKNTIRTEIIESLKLVARQNKPLDPQKEFIQFKNYIVNIETGAKIKPSSKYFFTNPINWDIGETEETPTIDKLFKEWVGEKNSKLLYEIIAYSLYRDYPIHRIFCFIGSGRNGKSKYLGLINKFIGNHNTSSTELDLLLERSFESIKLYKKLTCIMGETNYNALKKTAILKKLTGQDLVGFELKGKTPFDDYNYAKIMISTNGIPITHDKSDGFYRRWLIVKFPNQFKEGKDILSTIPNEEYENLALKCLNLLPRLLDRGTFHNEPSIEDKKRMYEDESNPLNKFLKEYCEEDFDSFVYKYEFNDKFTHWLKTHGYRPFHNRELNSIMRDTFDDSKKAKGESIIWAWIGLKWKEKKEEISNISRISNNFQLNPYIENQPKTIGNSGNVGNNPLTFDELLKSFNQMIPNDESIKIDTFKDMLSESYFFTESQYENYIKKAKEQGELVEIKRGVLKLL